MSLSEPNPILDFVSEIEYLKGLARKYALDAADQLNFDEIQKNPDAHMALLIAILLDDLEQNVVLQAEDAAAALAAAVGFDLVPDTLDADIQDALDVIDTDLTDAADAWAHNLDTRLADFENSGLSPEVIAAAIATFEESMTAELADMLGSAAENAVNATASLVMDSFNIANGDINSERRWVTVTTKKSPSCEGDMKTACAPRHGVVNTMAEWKKLGEPNAPNLNCVLWNGEDVCRCVLVPAAYQTATPLSAIDAIAAGRARARG